MRIAALYDIHGNLPALEAVLREVDQAAVDLILVGGDVFPGPMPSETLERLLSLQTPSRFILGNGDREVMAQMAGVETDWFRSAQEQWRDPVRWTAQQLASEHPHTLNAWPATFKLQVNGIGRVLFCHGTPRNDTEVVTRLTPVERLLPIFEGLDTPLVVCGHTHMQFDRIVGTTRVVNAGSVGMPYGEPGAYWLLLGPEVALRFTQYDLANAADRIRDTEYPQADDFARRHVLEPPSQDKMLEAFGRME